MQNKDQVVTNPNIKCRKCLQNGHKQDSCVNDWKCLKCLQSGHQAKDCKPEDYELSEPSEANIS